MATWFNEDGLYIKYGTSEAVSTHKGGEDGNLTNRRTIEFDLDLTTLATATDSIVNDGILFPDNARIEEVEIVVLTAADSAGDAATLDIGLIGYDRSTAVDAESFVKAATEASMDTAGKKLHLFAGVSTAGDDVGTTPGEPGYITAGAGTEVFTAGLIKVRIHYFFL
jgi:hypothetical protein